MLSTFNISFFFFSLFTFPLYLPYSHKNEKIRFISALGRYELTDSRKIKQRLRQPRNKTLRNKLLQPHRTAISISKYFKKMNSQRSRYKVFSFSISKLLIIRQSTLFIINSTLLLILNLPLIMECLSNHIMLLCATIIFFTIYFLFFSQSIICCSSLKLVVGFNEEYIARVFLKEDYIKLKLVFLLPYSLLTLLSLYFPFFLFLSRIH